MPVSSSGAANGRPGPVTYWNTVTGQVQIDPKGWNISSFDLCYTTGTVNVSGSTPGPLRYSSGTSPTSTVVSAADGLLAQRTLPAGAWTFVFCSQARIAGTVSLVRVPTLATGYSPGNGAGGSSPYATNPLGEPVTPGWFTQPWSFPKDLIDDSSITSMTMGNWRTFGHSGWSAANTLGFGDYRGTSFFRIDGITGGCVSPVVPVTPAPWVTAIRVTSGTQTQASAGHIKLSGTNPFLKAGRGTLILDMANTLTGSSTIWSGELRLASAVAASASKLIPMVSGTLSFANGLDFTIGGLSPLAGGVVDVGSSVVTIVDSPPSSELLEALLSGRGAGRWDGARGFTSSVIADQSSAGLKRTIGWNLNSDGSTTVGYAAHGDAIMDGLIDIHDIAAIITSGRLDTGMPATWADGDFNYDGIVDVLDIKDFLAADLFDAGPYRTVGQLAVAVVPEPSTLSSGFAAILFGCALFLRHQISQEKAAID